MKTILVTGGAGFIGSHLIDELLKKTKHRVVVVDDLSHGKRKNLNKKVKFYKTSINSPRLKSIFEREKPDFVFHLAAQIDVRKAVLDPLNDTRINILGSLNLLELCYKNKVKKFIFTSSGGAIYPEECTPATEETAEMPISPYGINKLCIDKYLEYYHRVWGLKYVSLRFSNIYGPQQDSQGESGVIAIFINKFLQKKSPTKFGNGKQTRDYVYVQDVVDLALKAMKSKHTGVYNVGTCKETSINDLIRIIKKVGGFKQKVKVVKGKKGEVRRSALKYNKALHDFGWSPKVNLEEGLEKTVEWFKKNPQKQKKTFLRILF